MRLSKPTLAHTQPKMDYIPLVTDDYKLAFVQATGTLPENVQRIIWNKVLQVEPVTPRAPIKPSPRLARLMNNWESRRKII